MTYIDTLREAKDLVTPGMSACQGCGAELCLRRVLQIAGENSVIGIPPGCMAGAGAVGWNFTSGLHIPVHITLLDNTAALLSGVSNMYQRQGRDDINVIGFAGDGATADCGFQSLSGAAERGEKVLYICYDNEGYMNTGFQRSSTTTRGSSTSTTPASTAMHGKAQHQKYMPLI
ncbi:NADH-dependent phenylglyoxylate, partial [bacterium]